ncbi:MAG TPA: TlpA disulfide reductase family protein [Pyrinomonadaceae bacterium]|nr:TlpA disulfide reductase family protein [Pyrinomonadaceae bacterium]
MSTRSYTPEGRFAVAVCCALVALLSLLLAACGNTDYTANKSSPSANKTATDTPQGTRMPRTALPMPPVATAHGSSSSTTAPNGVNLVHASQWTTLDGRRAKGADFEGKVLVLDFWATYCPPCRDEVPHLIALQRRYGAQGLHVVGLNVGGAEDRPKVPDFIEEFGIQYALGYPDDQMSELFFADNSAIPQTYVYDRRGRLVKRFVGFGDTMPAELERAVQAALEEKSDE